MKFDVRVVPVVGRDDWLGGEVPVLVVEVGRLARKLQQVSHRETLLPVRVGELQPRLPGRGQAQTNKPSSPHIIVVVGKFS